MKYVDIVRGRIAELESERAAAVAAIEAAVATAETENRSALNETEDAAYQAASVKVAAADAELATERTKLAGLEAVMAAQTTNTRRAPIPGIGPKPEEFENFAGASLGELRSAAAKVLDDPYTFATDAHRASVEGYLNGRNRAVAAEVAIRTIACSSEDYIRAFGKLVNQQQWALTPDEQRAVQRAMTAGTGSSGGFAVPTPIDPTMIITGAGARDPIRELATVRTLADGLVWKGVTAAQIAASYDAEAAEVSDDSPVLSQPLLTTVMGRVFVPYSIEAGMDVPNLVSELSDLFADAKYNLENGSTGFMAGSGSGQPYGLFTEVDATTASRVAAATGSTYAIADVYAVHQALPARFQTGGNRAWAMRRQTLNSTRQFATANNYHGFTVDVTAGTVSQLLGDRVVEVTTITSTVTTGNSIILYGDFSRFLIMDKIGMQVESIPHLLNTSNNLPSGQRGIFAWFRHGSRCLDVNAFRTLRL